MPRYPSSGARLYLRPARSGGIKYWYIREGGRSHATGFAEGDKAGALEQLAAYAPYTKLRPALIIDNAPKQFQPLAPVVYFVSVDQPDFPIKIGYATDMKSRLSGLQNSFPFDLIVMATIDGGRDTERDLHLIYREYRIRGEWFYRTPEIMRHIECINRSQTPATEPDIECLPDIDAIMDSKRRALRLP